MLNNREVFKRVMADENGAPSRDAAAQKKFDAAMKKMDTGDFKAALTAFKKYTDEFPDDAEGWYFRAECANYAGGIFGARVKDEDVTSAYTKAIELDDSRVEFYQSYGSFCISVGMYEEAEKAYCEAANIDESMSSTLYSEFAIEYFNHVIADHEILDDPANRVKYARKALGYMLKALEMGEDEAANLLDICKKEGTTLI